MRKFPLILSFAIIALGFGVSLHRSLTGNGLLDENLDSHILAQLDDSGDDTGGDDTTGGGTSTGGGTMPLPNIYLKNSKFHYYYYNTILLSDNNGIIATKCGTLYELVPNSQYRVYFEEYSCEYSFNENDYCDLSIQRKFISSYEEIEFPDINNGSDPRSDTENE